MSVLLKEIISYMESYAPIALAEKWDNPGLLVGSPNQDIKSVMTVLDVTAENVAYAVSHDIDLIISHHPVIFKGLKSLRTDRYEGWLMQELLINHIAVYSAHTNLDVADGGVNDVLAERLGLKHVRGLAETGQDNLYKLVVYVPEDHAVAVKKALGDAGAGYIGHYSHCMYSTTGTGQFKPLTGTHPYIGAVGQLERLTEVRIETIVPAEKLAKVLTAMLAVHPYEEVAYDLYKLANEGKKHYLGRMGELPELVNAMVALKVIKKAIGAVTVKVSGNLNRSVRTIALCGGAGAEFMVLAKEKGADLYITGDVKYHEGDRKSVV